MSGEDDDNVIDKSMKVDQFLSFPVLTRELGTPGGGRAGAPAPAAGGAPIAQLVEATLRDVLGWRPRASDPRGFAAALSQSFAGTAVAGRTEWKWVPRSYAVSVQASLGSITGAQASLFARARNVADQVLPLLAGLRPLIPDADPENVASTLAILRSSLSELVNEIGVLGGPRVPRVNELFRQLLGSLPSDPSPEKIGGQLGFLRNRLALQRSQIKTVEDEQNYTNFLLVVDYIQGLEKGWLGQRVEFSRTASTAFFGTQLVGVSRLLAVIAEGVQEYYAVLDSLFLGAAERETALLRLGSPGNLTILSVAELFGWVERFVSEEAPRLLQDGGLDGVSAAQSTLLGLVLLVEDSLRAAQAAEGHVALALRDPRSRPRVEEIVGGLNDVAKLFDSVLEGVQPVPEDPLTVVDFDPAKGGNPVPPDGEGSPEILSAEVTGTGFADGVWVSLGRAVVINEVQVLSPKRLQLKFWLRKEASGIHDLTVIARDGTAVQKRKALIVDKRVGDTEGIADVEPTFGTIDSAAAKVSLKPTAGHPFPTVGVSVRLRRQDKEEVPPVEIRGTVAPNSSAAALSVSFDLSDTKAAEGQWDLVVTAANEGAGDPEKNTHSLVKGFTIRRAVPRKPIIAGVSRLGWLSGEKLMVEISGSGFTDPVAVSFGPGVQVPIHHSSGPAGEKLEVEILPMEHSAGLKTAVVINEDGQVAVLRQALTIAPGDERPGRNVKHQ